jgi:hypothetical protein
VIVGIYNCVITCYIEEDYNSIIYLYGTRIKISLVNLRRILYVELIVLSNIYIYIYIYIMCMSTLISYKIFSMKCKC